MRGRWTWVCFGLVACGGGADSLDYKTDEIEATTRVSNQSGTSALIEVVLLAPSTGVAPVYVKLADGYDALSATHGGGETPLDQLTQGAITYGATVDVAGDLDFTIDFTRSSGGSASNAIRLPAPFEFGSVSSEVSPDGALELSWTGGDTSAQLTMSGDCIQSFGTQIDLSSGSASIPFDQITPNDAENPTACDLAITAYAETEGTVDAAWREGSSAIGKTWRETTSRYSP